MEQAALATKQLDANDPFDGLTSSQYHFVKASFSGLSDVQAFRQTFDCSQMNETTIRRKAVETAHNPLVMAKLRQLREESDRQSTLLPGLTRNFVTNGIMGLALTAQKESVKLQAYIALGKVAGIDLFRDVKIHETVPRTVEDVDRELRERISELSKTIEGSAREAEPAELARRKRQPKR